MKFEILFSAAILFLLCSCNGRQDDKEQANDDSTYLLPAAYLKDDGDSIIVDPFEIEIELTDKAKERITNNSETIIVSIFYYGYPKDKKIAVSEKDGTLYLAGVDKEINFGQIVRFENVKISKKDYKALSDKDFELNLNVYSGRKTFKENVLHCETLLGKVSKVVNKKHILKCKLIYGDIMNEHL